MSQSTEHWASETTSYRPSEDAPDFTALVYDPTPGGRENADGSTTYSVRFPALILTEYVSDPETIAAKLAVELNAFAEMLEALKDTLGTLRSASRALTDANKLVLGGKQWGERDIARIEAVIAKAEGRS